MEQNCEKGTYIHFRQEAAKTISTLENLKKKNEKEKDSKGSESKRAKKNGKDLSFRHRGRTKEQCGASKTEVNTNKDWKTKRG